MISIVAAFLILSIVASITSNTIYGQVITLQESLPSNAINLSIVFSNRTNATLDKEPITEEQGNAVVAAINAILPNFDDLEELPIAELPEIEEEDEIEEDSDSNGNGGGNDNGDDNGDDDNDNDNGDDDDLIIPPPIPEDPIDEDEDDEPIGGSEEIRMDLGKRCHTDERVYNEELGGCIPAHGEICLAVVTYGDGPCDEYPAEFDPDLSK